MSEPGEMPTRKNAIRMHYVECCGFNRALVRRCKARECWLWPYRMGSPETDAVREEMCENREAAE